jgi:hypothetical protein
MIISLKHNYIYIRTRKTGSTSIESILRANLGPDDIIVREDPRVLAPVLKPGAVPPTPDEAGLLTHIKVSQLRPLIRDEVWDRLFKFTSERHPYEKALSFANYRVDRMKTRDKEHKVRKHGSFEDFLDRVVRKGKYSSFRFYAIDGKSVADDYVKLETMAADMHRIGARLGIAMPEEMPHRRETERADTRPARDILSGAQKDTIYEHCRAEFELLGYAR